MVMPFSPGDFRFFPADEQEEEKTLFRILKEFTPQEWRDFYEGKIIQEGYDFWEMNYVLNLMLLFKAGMAPSAQEVNADLTQLPLSFRLYKANMQTLEKERIQHNLRLEAFKTRWQKAV